MASNRLKQSLRILWKEKRVTLINILGLAISLACTLFMLLWVQRELSYERFHKDYRQLYRVEEDQYYSGKEAYHVNVTPRVSGPVWKEEIPEIEEQCRLARLGGHLFTLDEQKYFEGGISCVDSSFFEMFSFDFKYGDPGSVLRVPNTMVINDEIARKYFGNENPVGKSILVNQKDEFMVSGVFHKPPDNTTLQSRVYFPWSYAETQPGYTDSWGSNSITTLVKLQKGSVDTVVNRKLTEVTDKYKENNTIDYMVAPVTGIHLHAYFGYGRSPGAIVYVYIFIAIALFVLIIACINFMNLSTARASVRSREIGMRKVNGAGRSHLVRQHLGESFLLSFVSVVFAFLLVMALLQPFNNLTGKEVSIATLFSPSFILGILGVLIVTTFLAGLYPAFYLSSIKPLTAIRDQGTGQVSGSGLLRKILVIFQFSLSVLLITGAMIASRQLNYMKNADLGFSRKNLVHIQLRGDLRQEYDRLREEFRASPDIESITASMEPPYRIGSNSGGIRWEGKDPEQNILVSFTGVHYDFIKTMKISLTEGRDFSEEFPSDMNKDTTGSFIINRTLADLIGEEEILGMELSFVGVEGPIVGIMENYHFQSLRSGIEPMAVCPVPTESLYNMIIRLSDVNPSAGLAFLNERWEELLPQYPFEYTYVDEALDNMYEAERGMTSLFRIFMLVAILIACLGLFALSSFTAQRRTREMGIRKILGAMEAQITMMMIRDFSLYIFISLLISLPAAGFLGRWWLREFSTHVRIGPGIFIFTTLIMVLVAILTVLFHAVRISRTDPARAMRYQ